MIPLVGNEAGRLNQNSDLPTMSAKSKNYLKFYAVLDIIDLRALLALAEENSLSKYNEVRGYSTVVVRADLLNTHRASDGAHQVDDGSITVDGKPLWERAHQIRTAAPILVAVAS